MSDGSLRDMKSVVPPKNNVPYLIAVVIMAMVALAAATAIQINRPDVDNTTLITMVFGFVATTTGTVLAFMKSQETHLAVNSRLEAFLKTSTQAARSEGRLQGTTEEQARVEEVRAKTAVDMAAELVRAADLLKSQNLIGAEDVKAAADKAAALLEAAKKAAALLKAADDVRAEALLKAADEAEAKRIKEKK